VLFSSSAWADEEKSGKQERIDLIHLLTDATTNLDMAIRMAAPMHMEMYSLFILTVLPGIALLALAYTLLGKTLGNYNNPFLIFLFALVAMIVTYPMPIEPHLKEQVVQQAEKADSEDGTLCRACQLNLDTETSPTVYEISLAVLLFHKLASDINDKMLEAVDNIFYGDDAHKYKGKRGSPLFMLKAQNQSFADHFREGPETRRAVATYYDLCGEIPGEPQYSNVKADSWRAFGLLGSRALGISGVSADSSGNNVSLGIHDGDEGWVSTLTMGLIEGQGRDFSDALKALEDATPKDMDKRPVWPGGMKIYTPEYWQYMVSEDRSEFNGTRFIKNPWPDGMSIDKFNSHYDELKDDQHLIFPKNCKDLYLIANLSLANWRKGYGNELKTFNPKIAEEFEDKNAIPRAYSILRSPEALQVTDAERRARKDCDNLAVAYNGIAADDPCEKDPEAARNIGMRSTAEGWVQTFYEWIQGIQLDVNVPILFGFNGFIYALGVILFPAIVAFSVIPGRHSTISKYFYFLAYVHIVLILQYMCLVLGTAVITSTNSAIGASSGTGIPMGGSSAAWLIAGHMAMVAGVLGSYGIAYMIVFNETMGLKAAGSGMAQAGRMFTTAAVAAGAATKVGSTAVRGTTAAAGAVSSVAQSASKAANGGMNMQKLSTASAAIKSSGSKTAGKGVNTLNKLNKNK